MADQDNTTFRTCSKCGEAKPFEPQFYRGNRSQCRECGRAESRRGYRKLDPDLRRERLREYRKANPDKCKAWDKARNERKPDRLKAYHKTRWKDRDKEKAREEHKAWRLKNPEKLRAMWERSYAKNKEYHNKRVVEWMRKNPEAAMAYRAKKRAIIANAEGSYTREDVGVLLKKYGRVCFYCRDTLKFFHLDHFIPLARGGTNYPANLRISCPRCNLKKQDKMPWEWMPERFKIENAA